jgi:hypothetical protein
MISLLCLKFEFKEEDTLFKGPDQNKDKDMKNAFQVSTNKGKRVRDMRWG